MSKAKKQVNPAEALATAQKIKNQVEERKEYKFDSEKMLDMTLDDLRNILYVVVNGTNLSIPSTVKGVDKITHLLTEVKNDESN